MGFGFRKSVSFGPFRFTASKGGISSSFGVRGPESPPDLEEPL